MLCLLPRFRILIEFPFPLYFETSGIPDIFNLGWGDRQIAVCHRAILSIKVLTNHIELRVLCQIRLDKKWCSIWKDPITFLCMERPAKYKYLLLKTTLRILGTKINFLGLNSYFPLHIYRSLRQFTLEIDSPFIKALLYDGELLKKMTTNGGN